MKYTKLVTQKLIFFKKNINISVQSVYSCKENKFDATLQCFNVYFSDIIWQPCPQWADMGDGDYVTDKFPYADLKPSYNLSKDTLDYNTK